MNDASHTPAQALLIKAAEDEQTLRLQELPDAIFGFHAQQAVEKLLKALLSALEVRYELTHDLDRLQLVLSRTGERLPQTPLSLSELTDFAVFYRYDLLFQYAVPERDDVLATVRQIREHAGADCSAFRRAPAASDTIDRAPAVQVSRIPGGSGASKHYASQNPSGSPDLR